MPKTKEQKEQIVEELVDKFSKMKSAVFAQFFGLKVKDTQELKKLCKEVGVEYQVVKKTLIRLALKKAGLEELMKQPFEGELAAAFSYEDEIAAAKTLHKFAKNHEALKLVGGILVISPSEKKFLDAASIKDLAVLPSKIELLARLVGSIKAPVSGFVNVLSGNLRSLLYVLNAIKEDKS